MMGESEERFRQLAESIQQVFWLCDLEVTRIFYVSPAYREIWGGDPEELYENSLSWFNAIHEDDRDIVRSRLDAELMRKEGFEAHFRIRRPDGEIRWIRARGFPVYNEAGEVYRLAGFAEDITGRRQIEEALRHRERQLAQAQAVAHLGSWEWDIPTDTVTWSDELYRIFGLVGPEFTPTFEGYLERVHPEDRERVRATVLESVARGSFEYVCRFVRPSGEVRYEWAQGEVIRDEEGKPVRMVGTAMDITERKHVEDALLESAHTNARFATAVENLSTGVVITDPHLPDNPIVYANRGFLAITGYLDSEILGRNARFLQGPGTDPALLQDIRKAIEERRSFKGRILNYRKVGTPFWNEMTISPVLDPQGRLINFVGVQSDITEQVRAEETIRTQLDEKTALLAEVHHRVKNNLQIISSILNMQVRALEDPQAVAALQESRSRIHAIALAHDTLYRTQSFARVDLAQYLRSLARQLQRAQIAGQRIELKLDLQSCQVPLTQAVPCGLLASELITNALKHAFTDQRPGEILLAVQMGKSTCTLIVGDNGPGLPDGLDLGKLRSVGLQLVQALAHQLRATIEITRQPGTMFKITFRLEIAAA